MKTAAVLSTLFASSAAFAPSQQASRSSSLAESPFANELGAQPPLYFFDPLGFLQDGNSDNFERLRGIEIKHGRISMLAVVGYLTTMAGVRLPGMEEVGGGLSAFNNIADLPPAVRSVFPLTAACMIGLELVMRDVTGEAQFPGDFRNGVKGGFGWDKYSPEVQMKKRAIELNNGRAAQMGIAGLVIHEYMGNLNDILPFQS